MGNCLSAATAHDSTSSLVPQAGAEARPSPCDRPTLCDAPGSSATAAEGISVSIHKSSSPQQGTGQRLAAGLGAASYEDACAPGTATVQAEGQQQSHDSGKPTTAAASVCGFADKPPGGPDVPLLTSQPTGAPWSLKLFGVPSPPNDSQRRLTGVSMGLYTASKSSELDYIMRTICHVFDAPYSSLAMYYNRCCWLTNASSNWVTGYLPWEVSACPWNGLVKQPQCIVCGELQEDARFHHMPWVESGLRCYVSAPLLASNGHRLGTVCFMDNVPRRVDAGMCRVLANLGELAIRIIERHVRLAERLSKVQHAIPRALNRLVEAAATGCDVRTRASQAGRPLRGLDEGLWEEAGTQQQNKPTDPQAAVAAVDVSQGQSQGVASSTPTASRAVAEDPRGVGAAQEAAAADLKPADILLASAFARQLRNVESLQDACCLIIDTGAPGWPVLYADETFIVWAGFSRNEILGKPLQAFLCSASPGLPPLNWAPFEGEVREGQRFLRPYVVAVHPQQHRTDAPPHDNGAAAGTLDSIASQTYVRKAASPAPEDWQTSSMAHDLNLPLKTASGRTNTDHSQAMDTADSAVVSRRTDGVAEGSVVSVDLLATLSTAKSSEDTENVLESVALQEQGQQALVSKVGPGKDGVHWHEAAVPAASASGTLFGTADSGAHVSQSQSGTAVSGRAGSTLRGQSSKPFNLSFRPMALDVLDSDALPLGIPSWVPLEACPTMMRLYAVRLHPVTHQPLPPQPLTPTLKVTSRHGSSLAKLANHLFPGLSLGHILGRGGYGTAYTGTWHDVSVVVKVQDHQLLNEEALRIAQVEVALGQLLRHPHLVRTLAHGAAEVAVPSVRTTPSDVPSSAATPRATPASTRGRGSRTFAQAPLDTQGVIPVYSGYTSLNEWSTDVEEEDWDDQCGDTRWFSHCDKEDLIHRDITQALSTKLPLPRDFVNAVAIPSSFKALASNPPRPTIQPTPPRRADPPLHARLTSIQSQSSRELPSLSLSQGLLTDQQFLLPAVTGTAGPHTVLLAQLEQSTPGAHMGPDSTKLSAGSLNSRATDDTMQPILYQPVFHAPGAATSAASSSRPSSTVDTSHNRTPPCAPAVGKKLAAAEPAAAGRAYADSAAAVVGSSSSQLYSYDSVACPSVTQEMAELMESGRQLASRIGAKPLQYPMHLRTFALLEYCDGGSLQDAIDRGWLRKGSCHVDSPPDLPKIVTLGSHIACAVAYLHGRGVVHADLSAANVLLCLEKPSVGTGQVTALTSDSADDFQSGSTVFRSAASQSRPSITLHSKGDAVSSKDMPRTEDEQEPSVPSLDPDGLYTLPTKRYSLAPAKARLADEMHFIAKVADFGKSCLLGPEGVAKAGGYATVTHMAPEVLTDHLLSPAADVYAVGVLLWQMYTGSRPWASLSHSQIIATVVGGEAQLEWPMEITAQLPAAQQTAARRLSALGRTCCACSTKDRPGMADVYSELTSIQQLLQHS